MVFVVLLLEWGMVVRTCNPSVGKWRQEDPWPGLKRKEKKRWRHLRNKVTPWLHTCTTDRGRRKEGGREGSHCHGGTFTCFFPNLGAEDEGPCVWRRMRFIYMLEQYLFECWKCDGIQRKCQNQMVQNGNQTLKTHISNSILETLRPMKLSHLGSASHCFSLQTSFRCTHFHQRGPWNSLCFLHHHNAEGGS